ncbi:MAG: hypothetical protein R3C03_21665 [Pirellulaceae bacterium]
MSRIGILFVFLILVFTTLVTTRGEYQLVEFDDFNTSLLECAELDSETVNRLHGDFLPRTYESFTVEFHIVDVQDIEGLNNDSDVLLASLHLYRGPPLTL